ncbi:MAG: NAD(P)/FAD-dependent oxidoreductase [Parvularculaceae bacterium]|nr:NAD(P)/FAD-dependent oxidoreductase [Parvularculaceae bacterium]
MSEHYDAIVIGAGAAGLFFAGEAAMRGVRVLAIDHARKLGEKIRISGGGRCNFTNIHAEPQNFISTNPKFAISALKGFGPRDFLARVEAAGIGWHEKKLGQLFCNDGAGRIIDLLVGACRVGGVDLRAGVTIENIRKSDAAFHLETTAGQFSAPQLIVATGGKSIPKLGATGFGYGVAERFGLRIIEPRAALVPLTFEGAFKEAARTLSGLSVKAGVTCPAPAPGKHAQKPPSFRDGLLFTHRGLSGPSVLQISSYWRESTPIEIDFLPDGDLFALLKERRAAAGGVQFQTALAEFLPRRLAQHLCALENWRGNLADWSDENLRSAAHALQCWKVTPSGSEGYRTAEVTLGGVDTDTLHSKTLEAKSVYGLYFIGEVVDVTGWLGGYNFQWAWASAFAAARAVAEKRGALA